MPIRNTNRPKYIPEPERYEPDGNFWNMDFSSLYPASFTSFNNGHGYNNSGKSWVSRNNEITELLAKHWYRKTS